MTVFTDRQTKLYNITGISSVNSGSNIACIFVTIDLTVREGRIQELLQERCDGNKNILHACVAMCAPLNNKDNEGGEWYQVINFWFKFIVTCYVASWDFCGYNIYALINFFCYSM